MPARARQFNEAHGTAKLSLYIPYRKGGTEVLNRLQHLAEEDDRSINYLVVEAILEYLERREQKS